jgi:enamine deaminase RidA (YjgF/YER057c/UK114 family)
MEDTEESRESTGRSARRGRSQTRRGWRGRGFDKEGAAGVMEGRRGLDTEDAEGMEKQLINPEALAKPRGFNHGILVSGGRLLFLAGQDASDAEGRIAAPGDVVGQLDRVLRNLRAVVEAAGGSPQDIVKLNVYVRDRDAYVANLKPLGEVFRAHFGRYYPAMALFEVSRLFQDDALIELEGIAVLGD